MGRPGLPPAVSHSCDFSHSFRRRPDVVLRVEGADAETDRTLDLGRSQLLVHQGGAVKAGATGDIVVDIEHGAGVRCLQPVDVEAEDGDMVGQIVLAIKSDTLDLPEFVPKQLGQGRLVFGDGIEAFLQNPGHAGLEAGNAHDIRRSIFQAVGIFLQVEPVSRTNARPAGARVADGDALPDVQPAYARRPEQGFVSREDQNVDIVPLDIDGHLARGLRGIDGQGDALSRHKRPISLMG